MSAFLHGVASGDPSAASVVIWTRVTNDDLARVPVSWVLAADRDFDQPRASGIAYADAEHDHTIKVEVEGLLQDTHYWYRFEALEELSPTGRTRTLPAQADHLRFAMVSCAKYNAGYLNAYSRIAARDDLNFLLHLGDYIYEASQTPPPSQTPSPDIGRPFDPLHECVTLEDYRRRYAQYRLDPDVQALHHAHPIIATVDDHEFADGAWREGATEHRPERYGPWSVRRAAAFRSRWEWLPVKMPDPSDAERVWQKVSVPPLADIFLIDTRSRRDEPVAGPQMSARGRTQLGSDQRDWLLQELQGSTATWKLLGNSSVLSSTWKEGLDQSVVPHLLKIKLVGADGLTPDVDQWDGYPEERRMLLDWIEEHEIRDLVVLSGDIHVSVAAELESDGRPVGVEFITTSLTSQNLDDKMGWEARKDSIAAEKAFMSMLPHVKWCDFDSHGYAVVDVDPERVLVEWWALETIARRSDGESLAQSLQVKRGVPRLEPADAAAGA